MHRISYGVISVDAERNKYVGWSVCNDYLETRQGQSKLFSSNGNRNNANYATHMLHVYARAYKRQESGREQK